MSKQSSDIDEMLEARIKKACSGSNKTKPERLAKKDAWSDKSLEAMMQKEVSKRLNELYPEVVENKVNEFEEEIKKLKFGSRNNNYSLEHLAKTAQERVSEADKKAHDIINNYLENELKESVKLSKNTLNSLQKLLCKQPFRAMGMMDKMLPRQKVCETEIP